MRRIIAGNMVSLDGVFEDPVTGLSYKNKGWAIPYQDEEVQQVVAGSMARTDSLLLGRVSYQSYAASFAGQTGGFADLINGIHKVVVSRTLTSADWANSTLLAGDAVVQVAALKRQPGKDIGLSGSGTLLRTLLAHHLVDELVLLVIPVILGSGKRLFERSEHVAALDLVDARPLRSGVAALTYRPKIAA